MATISNDKYNNRIFSIDNAHLPESKGEYKARIVVYHHLHKNKNDKGIPYEFESTR